MYKPTQPFNVPALVLTATFTKVNGVPTKTFQDGEQFFCSAKSYGGTEREVNNKYVIEDTLDVETWFRSDITSADHIRLLDDGSEWEILNTPEDIDRRHLYLKFKVRRIKGGA